jgi:GntR family transcriptional regulator / MocR family aminotransferase
MPRVPASFFPPITLDPEGITPLYRQLYDWFRHAILGGQFRPGQQVPSSRSLATELKISRIPVLSAYEQLHAEGYLETFVGAGTRVARSIPDEALRPSGGKSRSGAGDTAGRKGPRRISRRAVALAGLPTHPWLKRLGVFRTSLPALDHFPLAAWSKLVARHSRKQIQGAMAYGDARGHRPLREAIAEYLRTVRAVRCEASQILVTTGSQQGLQLCAHVLLDPDERVWMEEPGYSGAHQAFMAAGVRMVPIPVDDEGLNVAEGIRRSRKARAAYITPSHQYPLGVSMSAARRMLLIKWASQNGAWIIEDDYDSEYRFASRPIASLQGMDTEDRVIYVGTFSKVLFPALRVGYLVVPSDLASAFVAARDASDISSSTLYQAVLADFIREGHFARHVRRMRMLYMERRRALVEALREEIGNLLEVVGEEAGMHLAAFLPPGMNDVKVSQNAAHHGISAMPLSTCYLKSPKRHGLILGYAGASVHQMRGGARQLRMCMER